MYWLLIIVAAMFEVTWVIGLKHAGNIFEWLLTIIAMIASFIILVYLGKKLPAGTVYIIFVGLGTLGTVLMEWILFGSHLTPMKILFILTLLIGIIGLNYQSSKRKNKEGESS